MEMLEGEVARVRLRIGGGDPEWVEACVTADGIWRLSETDMPDPFLRSNLTQMIQIHAKLQPKPTRYLPSRHLEWPVRVQETWPGSIILDWRGRREEAARKAVRRGMVWH